MKRSDDRRFQHSASHQHLPVPFADDVASKPDPLTCPFPVWKAVYLCGRLHLGACY